MNVVYSRKSIDVAGMHRLSLYVWGNEIHSYYFFKCLYCFYTSISRVILLLSTIQWIKGLWFSSHWGWISLCCNGVLVHRCSSSTQAVTGGDTFPCGLQYLKEEYGPFDAVRSLWSLTIFHTSHILCCTIYNLNAISCSSLKRKLLIASC